MAGKTTPRRRKLTAALVAFTFISSGLIGAPAPARAQVQTINCLTGFGVGLPPLPPLVFLTSLKTVPNPVFPKDPVTLLPTLRADLVAYIANPTAAIQLGKALFWDMRAGSDNKTACATCHFKAGADGRTKNQLNPGPIGADFVANYALTSADFPFTDFVAGRDTDNIAGSQGVRKSDFVSVSKSGVELTAGALDPLFNVNGVNVRQVTGKNTPSAINAVFNHRNFWNGRAQPEFNGVNPWGSRDTSAKVWMVVDGKGNVAQTSILIPDASAASQAVGPALNPVEMSADGRRFEHLGRKLLGLKPLALQKVDPTDSVLGSIAGKTTGLSVTYGSLIQQAFQPKWWNSSKSVTLSGASYSLMEANFSLYWGLSIMLYEATLVSDQTPMDQYLGIVGTNRPGPADPTASILNGVANRLAADYGYGSGVAGILRGLDLFEAPFPPPFIFPNGQAAATGRECIACHLGANTTSASMLNLVAGLAEPGHLVLKNAGFNLKMERMFMQVPPVPTDELSIMAGLPPAFFTDQVTFNSSTYDVTVTHMQGVIPTPPYDPFTVPGPARVATYDGGWYNLGVRPTADDLGLGDVGGPGPLPLSWTQLYQTTLPDPGVIKVPGGGLTCLGAGNANFPGEVLTAAGVPVLSGPLRADEPTDVAGTFKTSALRNVELNGPYFHNGGKSTLKQVVEFYDDGGDFANDTQSPLIKFYGFLSRSGLGMTTDEVNDLVAFLLALTDERVRWEKAPFDHPQLVVPNGDDPAGTDSMINIPAVGAAGATTPLQPFLNLNPFQP